jgi:hypothetical protein
MKPRYFNDCEDCVFIGQLEEWDFYVCRRGIYGMRSHNPIVYAFLVKEDLLVCDAPQIKSPFSCPEHLKERIEAEMALQALGERWSIKT